MTDDDELFEREMASMGLGPSASAVRTREDRSFLEEVESAEAHKNGGEETPTALPDHSSSGRLETEAEAAKIFEEAMGELWGEARVSAPEVDPTSETKRQEPSAPARPPEVRESDTQANRLFEEAIRELTSTPVKEEDRPVMAPAPDPWSESTEVITRMIRKGRLRHDSELDLHGMTQREARKTVGSYLANSAMSGARMVRIVCGRGLHSRSGSMLLRDTLPTWLQADFEGWVARSFRAPRELGGEGAWYVILRRP